MTYAIVQNGVVVNTVEWDGVTPWTPPLDTSIVEIPNGAYVGIGSTYADGQFGPPPQPTKNVFGV